MEILVCLFGICVSRRIHVIVSVGRNDIITVISSGEDLDEGDNMRPVVLAFHMYKSRLEQHLCSNGIPVIGVDDLVANAVKGFGPGKVTPVIGGSPGCIQGSLDVLIGSTPGGIIGRVKGGGIVVPPLIGFLKSHVDIFTQRP